MHRPISDQAGGKGNAGKGQGGRQGRSFEAPAGGFPKQAVPAPKTEGGEAEAKPRKFKERKKGFTLLELLIVIGIIVIVASLVLAVSSSVVRASEERATKNTLEVLNMAAEEYQRTVDRRISYRSAAVASGIAQDPTVLAGSTPPVPLRYDVDTSPVVPPAGTGVTAWTSLATPYSSAAGGLPAYSALPFRRTAALIGFMSESPTCAVLMQKLPEAIFRGIKPYGNTPFFTAVRHCVDAWDTPIIAVFPGRDARRVADATGAADNPNFIDKDGTVKCDSEWGLPTAGGMQVSCKDRRILFMSAGNDSRFTAVTGGVYSLSNDNLYSYEP